MANTNAVPKPKFWKGHFASSGSADAEMDKFRCEKLRLRELDLLQQAAGAIYLYRLKRTDVGKSQRSKKIGAVNEMRILHLADLHLAGAHPSYRRKQEEVQRKETGF